MSGKDPGKPSTASPQPEEAPLIHHKSLIAEALDRNPEASEAIFAEMNLPCATCAAVEIETLEAGFKLLGRNREDLDTLIERLNAMPAVAVHELEAADSNPGVFGGWLMSLGRLFGRSHPDNDGPAAH